MLTATFNSYGDRQISTPHKIYTPEPIDKKSAELITPARGLLYQIWQKSIQWGLLGKWVKYNKNYFYLFIYLYLFFFDQPTGQTLGRIFTRDSSLEMKSRKDVPVRGYKT